MNMNLEEHIAYIATAVGLPLAFFLGYFFPRGGRWRTAVATFAAFLIAGLAIEHCAKLRYCYGGDHIVQAVTPVFAIPLYWLAAYCGIRVRRSKVGNAR